MPVPLHTIKVAGVLGDHAEQHAEVVRNRQDARSRQRSLASLSPMASKTSAALA